MSHYSSRIFADPLSVVDVTSLDPQQFHQGLQLRLNPATPAEHIMIPIFGGLGMRLPHYVQHESGPPGRYRPDSRTQEDRDYERRHSRHSSERSRRDHRDRRERDRDRDSDDGERRVSRRDGRGSRDRDREPRGGRERDARDWPAGDDAARPVPRVWDMEPDPRDVEHERQLQLHHAAAAAAAAAAAVSNPQPQLFLPSSAVSAMLPQPFLPQQMNMVLAGPSAIDTATLINMNLAASAALQQQQEAAAPELIFRSQQPNNTVMIRGLAQHVTENDIRQEILNVNLVPKDIRLIRKKDSGASRGFAFVEFSTVQEAARWMELKQGVLAVGDQYRAVMQYSLPKDGLAGFQSRPLQDWFCIKCGAHNFKRRDQCYKCGADRSESDLAAEGSEEVSPHPTNTLLLRGLDVTSTEETVLSVLQAHTQLPIRSVRLGRDPTTGFSRGVCYLELSSVVDAMHLNNQLSADQLIIGGRAVVVSYCRLPDTAGTAGDAPVDTSRMSILELAEYSAKLYAKTPEEYESYKQYYEEYYKVHGTQGGAAGAVSAGAAAETQSDSANAAAAVAQTALQRVQKKPTAAIGPQPQPQPHPQPQPQQAEPQPAAFDEEAVYPPPDTSSFQYDETSGYYYDSTTGLYYDSSSQYFYNSASQRYLYWDAGKSKYCHMPADGGETGADGKKRKEDKDVKVKVAKKIAKDMERWAKSMKKKEARATASPIIPVGTTMQQEQRSARSADIGYALFEKRAAEAGQAPTSPPEQATSPNNSGLVASYGGDSGDEEEGAPSDLDPSMVDLTKMACLLCKRAFASKEQLQKHLDKSDLHKKNLEEHKKTVGLAGGGSAQYRDRAAERRSKYGEPDRPRPPPRKPAPGAAATVTASLPARPVAGIGNKMMQAMGWKDGQGLGRDNQGRTNPVEADRRTASAGLGMPGSSYGALAGDTYKECVKKTMFARFQEMNGEER